MSEREEKFERMLKGIQDEYADVLQKMEKLKAQDKTKTATYRQLMGNKMTLAHILTIYKLYDLID